MRRPTLDAVRGFDRAVYVVAFARLVNVFGLGLVYPFATIYFHLDVGIALSVVGFGLLANNVTTGAGTIVGGYFADRRGRKPVMVASMALSSVTLAAWAFVVPVAAATPLSPAVVFVAVATLSGLTMGLYAPAGQAMTADLTEGPERDQAFSLLKVANSIGFGSGLVVGGLLYEAVHVFVFVLNGATSALVAVLLVFLLPRLREPQTDVPVADSLGNWSRVVTRRRVLALVVLNVGFAVMYSQMQTTIPIVAKEGLGLSASQLGTMYVLNPLTIAVLQIPLIHAVGDWRRTRGMVASAGFWAASMLAVWLVSPSLWAVGVALVGAHLVLRTVGEILHQPLIVSLTSDIAGADERGTHLSVLELAKRLGFGLGSFVGGLFFDYGLSSELWLVLTAVCGVLAVGVLVMERHVTPTENGMASAAD